MPRSPPTRVPGSLPQELIQDTGLRQRGDARAGERLLRTGRVSVEHEACLVAGTAWHKFRFAPLRHVVERVGGGLHTPRRLVAVSTAASTGSRKQVGVGVCASVRPSVHPSVPSTRPTRLPRNNTPPSNGDPFARLPRQPTTVSHLTQQACSLPLPGLLFHVIPSSCMHAAPSHRAPLPILQRAHPTAPGRRLQCSAVPRSARSLPPARGSRSAQTRRPQAFLTARCAHRRSTSTSPRPRSLARSLVAGSNDAAPAVRTPCPRTKAHEGGGRQVIAWWAVETRLSSREGVGSRNCASVCRRVGSVEPTPVRVARA
jgi:hypothetical protein